MTVAELIAWLQEQPQDAVVRVNVEYAIPELQAEDIHTEEKDGAVVVVL